MAEFIQWTPAARANFHTVWNARPIKTDSIYGIVDAAADESLHARLMAEPESSRVTCLFEGEPALRYDNVAPYLIVLNTESPLAGDWMDFGWEKNWGIWATTSRSMALLKAHLKKFLFVKTANDEKSYFRFYDPQVLDQIMPVFNLGQRGEFFGLNYKPIPSAYFSATNKNNFGALRRYVPKQSMVERLANASALDFDKHIWVSGERQ